MGRHRTRGPFPRPSSCADYRRSVSSIVGRLARSRSTLAAKSSASVSTTRSVDFLFARWRFRRASIPNRSSRRGHSAPAKTATANASRAMYSQLTPRSYRSEGGLGSADGHAEELLQLALQVPEVRLRVHPRADRPLQELPRLVRAPEPVDVLAQPVRERLELAAFEQLVEVADVRLGALPQLHRDDVAERVRREVPEAHVRPVDVLEDAVGEIGRLQAEVLAHLPIERLGEVADVEPAGEQVSLDLEAEDDVQAVRHLVGVDAPQRRLHLVQRPLERLERHVRERWKLLLQERVEETPRRRAAADEVLPHAALRLVEGRRDAVGERGARE